jgi:hypothetical protein
MSPSADLRAFVCGPAAVLSASLRSRAAQPVTSSVHAASQSLLAAAYFFPSPRSCSPTRALSGRVFQLLFGVMSVSCIAQGVIFCRINLYFGTVPASWSTAESLPE